MPEQLDTLKTLRIQLLISIIVRHLKNQSKNEKQNISKYILSDHFVNLKRYTILLMLKILNEYFGAKIKCF